MKRPLIWCGAVLTVVFSTSALLGADEAKTQLTKAGKAYDAAVLAKDAKALSKLYDDAGVFFNEKGKRFDKRGFVALYTDPKMTWATATSKVDSLRIFGDTAIDSGVWTGTGKYDGKPFRMKTRYVDVWVKKGGAWVVTYEQASPLPEAGK